MRAEKYDMKGGGGSKSITGVITACLGKMEDRETVCVDIVQL
jgi:hypothetical protein